MADTKTASKEALPGRKALVDLTLSEVQQIARDLGVRGWDMNDRAYLVKCIQAKRIANARAGADRKAQAAVEEAARQAAEAYVAAPEADFSDPTAPTDAADYEAMGVDDLQALADERGVAPEKGSGRGGAVVKALQQ